MRPFYQIFITCQPSKGRGVIIIVNQMNKFDLMRTVHQQYTKFSSIEIGNVTFTALSLSSLI